MRQSVGASAIQEWVRSQWRFKRKVSGDFLSYFFSNVSDREIDSVGPSGRVRPTNMDVIERLIRSITEKKRADRTDAKTGNKLPEPEADLRPLTFSLFVWS